MFVNVYLPPMPTPARCLALGKAIARIVASRPERVAILASGGMSHYPGTWKYYQPEFEFDRWAIERMEQGDIDAVAALTPEQLDEVGNTELLTWFVMFGAIGNRRGESLSYQPTSHHGHGVMRFLPERTSEPPSPVQERYGGFAFKNQGFEFYRYPDAALYPVHKLLFDLKENEALRERFLGAMDEVSAEYALTPRQAEAMRTLDVAPLVELGVHQILGLSSLLVVRQHKARLEATGAG